MQNIMSRTSVHFLLTSYSAHFSLNTWPGSTRNMKQMLWAVSVKAKKKKKNNKKEEKVLSD